MVLRCRHRQLGQVFALKKMRLELENLNQLKESFVDIKKLDDPNIIKFKALYISSQLRTAFLVMELY